MGKALRAAAAGVLLAVALPGRGAEDRAVKTRVAPVYPEIARRMRISGDVKLEATVDADGKVTDVKTVSGNRTLQNAAEEAVRKWRFVPGPGVSVVEVTVTFAMAD